MDNRLSRIETIYLICNLILILGAIAVFVGVGKLENNPANYIGSVMVVIGTAGVSGLGWLLGVQGKKEIAQSNARAQEAQEAAALATENTTKLKLLLAWRRMDPKQTQNFIKALSVVPEEDRTEIWVQFVEADPEVVVFQEDIRAAVKAAGFTASYFSGWERAVGIKVNNINTPTGLALRNALHAAEIDFHISDLSKAPGGKDTPVILVGSKPPPEGSNVRY
ncbi:hypothetical protein ACBP93_06550 [Paenalcaligenes hominis]|uniref:hypothetical protein n=1 Tax=Paenalcaligenes hominis TaxID=643674 RepID=UPI003523B467